MHSSANSSWICIPWWRIFALCYDQQNGREKLKFWCLFSGTVRWPCLEFNYKISNFWVLVVCCARSLSRLFFTVPPLRGGESCVIVCLVHLLLNSKHELVLSRNDFRVISTLTAWSEVFMSILGLLIQDCGSGLSLGQHSSPGTLCAE